MSATAHTTAPATNGAAKPEQTADELLARAQEAEARAAAAEERADRIANDMKLLEEELRGKRRQLADHRKHRNQQRGNSPRKDDIEHVYTCWHDAIAARNPRRKTATLGQERWDAIDRALQAGQDRDRLALAVVGIVLEPFDIEGKVYDDITHALLKKGKVSEIKIERFAEVAERAGGVPKPRTAPLREIVLAAPGAVDAGDQGVSFFCMRCATDPQPELEGSSSIAALGADGELRCERGCSHKEHERALRDWYAGSGMVPCPTCGRT